jgi:hypothetical protein
MKASLLVIFREFSDKNLQGSKKFEKTHINNLIQMLKDWKGLFNRFIPNEEEQINFIAVLETLCIEQPEFADVFHIIIQYLNSEEFAVINDSVIKRWSSLTESQYPTSENIVEVPNDSHRLFVDKMKKFIEQL